MSQESYHPQWAEMRRAHRRGLEILGEVLGQPIVWDAPDSIERDLAAMGHEQALAVTAMQEEYIGRLEMALWAAEAELAQVQTRYTRLTEPLGRGKKRSIEPTEGEHLIREVDYVLHCAEMDGKQIPLKDAVVRALKSIHARDRNGQPRTLFNLQDLVESNLEAALAMYRRRVAHRSDTSTDK